MPQGGITLQDWAIWLCRIYLSDGSWWDKKIWKIKGPLKGLFFLVSSER
jgi:hypothetical protein